jgi:Mn2+/Fe2+ NRAMP family transporter
LLVANTINIGADLAAMGAAAGLVLDWNDKVFTIAFAILSLLLQLFVPYHRYVRILKWLTLALFAYVGVVFTVHIGWLEVLARTALPQLEVSAGLITVIVAVFGTTISPYPLGLRLVRTSSSGKALKRLRTWSPRMSRISSTNPIR